ncbi:MAG TPA: cytochrome c oxidase assembly protein [Actinomycetota bacterium]
MTLPPFALHPEVILLVAALAWGYAWALARLGPDHAPAGERPATRGQVTAYGLGVLTIAVAALWPIHDLSERYLFSVHMFQHMLISLVAPPLLLFGMPAWLLRLLLRPRWVHAMVRRATRPFVALVLFNSVILLTHWPAWVNLTLHSEPFHLLSHTMLFVSASCMWWPVLSPLPEMPTLSYPARMLYLFLQSIVPTVPASFLTFGSTPLYHLYTTVPRIWGIDAVTDQRIAGLEMKILGGFILWGAIAVIFFKWYGQEQKTEGWDALEWGRVERELRPEAPGRTKATR